MKKISEHSNNVRESNKNFFILEKYNNDVKDSMMKSLTLLVQEAKKLNMSVSEYADTLSKIAK